MSFLDPRPQYTETVQFSKRFGSVCLILTRAIREYSRLATVNCFQKSKLGPYFSCWQSVSNDPRSSEASSQKLALEVNYELRCSVCFSFGGCYLCRHCRALWLAPCGSSKNRHTVSCPQGRFTSPGSKEPGLIIFLQIGNPSRGIKHNWG